MLIMNYIEGKNLDELIFGARSLSVLSEVCQCMIHGRLDVKMWIKSKTKVIYL